MKSNIVTDKDYNPKIMKTLILLMLVLTIASVSSAQYVDIPDANFKNALISAGVDTSGDGEISYAECEVIKKLYVKSEDIADLTGKKKRGRAYGYYYLSVGFISLAESLIFGLIYDFFSFTWAIIYISILLFICIIIFALTDFSKIIKKEK